MAGRPHPHRVASTRSLFKLSILSASLLLGTQGVMAADCTDLGNISGECTITENNPESIVVNQGGLATTVGDLTLVSAKDKQLAINGGSLTVAGDLNANSQNDQLTVAGRAVSVDGGALQVKGNALLERTAGSKGAALDLRNGVAKFDKNLAVNVNNNKLGDGLVVHGGELTVDGKVSITMDSGTGVGLRVYDLNQGKKDAVVNLNGGIDINSAANNAGIYVHDRVASVNTAVNIAGDSIIHMTGDDGIGIQLDDIGVLTFASGSTMKITTEGVSGVGMALKGSAVELNGAGALNITTEGEDAIGLLIANGAQGDLKQLRVTTTGDGAYGVSVRKGSGLNMASGAVGSLISTGGEDDKGFVGNAISTSGVGASALRAEGDVMTTAIINADSILIDVTGEQAHGIHAISGGHISLTNGGSMTTLADALVNDSLISDAKIKLSNTEVTTAQGSAIVSTANDGLVGITELEGVTLNSPTQAAIKVDGLGVHGITLSKGSQATNHNGTWLQATGDGASEIMLDASAVSGMATTATGSTTDVTLSNGSSWLDAGQSTVSKLTNNGSLVSLQNGKAGDVLNVSGNYVAGTDAKLALDVTLNGDGSASDKLVIGGDTSGTTTVAINNTGGTGVKVVNGIEVISVGGKSNGVFEQDGRIVAGAYDYYLGKGDGVATDADNWYLTNKLTPVAPVDPKEPNPIRPEAGSYLGNYLAANTMFNMRLYDRLGELGHRDEGNIGMWTRLVGGQTRFTDASGALSTKSDRSLVQIGADVLQWELDKDSRIHLGAMAGYAYNDLSVRTNSPDAQASKLKTHSTGKLNGYSFGVYGTYYGDKKDQTGLYVDSWLLFNHFDAKMRGSAGVGEEQYVLRGWTASAETGYAFKLGQRAETGYYIQPQAQLTWMGVSSGDVREKNGTLVKHKDDDNIQTRLGVRLYAKADHEPQSTGYKAFVEANWLHNTSDYKISMDDVNDHIRGVSDLAEVKLGLEGKISKTGSWWANLGYQTGKNDFRDTTVNLGMKKYF